MKRVRPAAGDIAIFVDGGNPIGSERLAEV